MARPDFGMDEQTVGGVVMSCRRIAPGLTMSDLVRIFDAARKQSEPSDSLSANPSKWPDVRGVTAVTDAILDAIYGAD